MTRERQRGFTLVEVMIAAMVLVMGMMGIMGLFSVALKTHRSNIDTARVAMIRADVLPDAESRALVTTDDGDLRYEDVPRTPVPGFEGFFYELKVNSGVENASGEVAELIISWRAGGRFNEAKSFHVLPAEKPFSELIRTRFKEERKP